ncbi:hypothetical protein BCT12_17015 [Vibrio breoganii]|nr:hypothetical protein BCT12_17015 [Vibrio breoganii]
MVITGATGHLGKKIFDYLDKRDDLDVWGLDIRPDTNEKIIIGDITRYEESWASVFEDCYGVIHLAADRDNQCGWESAVPNNIDATNNVFHAAAKHGVKRFVFASSNWVVGGYRFVDSKLTPDITPNPINPYGVTKLVGERTGKYFSEQYDMDVVSARIGWTQWTHNNQPGAHMEMGRWGQLMWLSDRDYLHGMEQSLFADISGHVVVNLMSNNKGMKWCLQASKNSIGYQPQDSAIAELPLPVRIKEVFAWLGQRVFPSLGKKIGNPSF